MRKQLQLLTQQVHEMENRISRPQTSGMPHRAYIQDHNKNSHQILWWNMNLVPHRSFQLKPDSAALRGIYSCEWQRQARIRQQSTSSGERFAKASCTTSRNTLWHVRKTGVLWGCRLWISPMVDALNEYRIPLSLMRDALPNTMVSKFIYLLKYWFVCISMVSFAASFAASGWCQAWVTDAPEYLYTT